MSIRLNFSWLLGSSIIKSGAQWLMMILVVKFFSTIEVGVFTLGYALTAPVFMLADLQLKSVFINDQVSNSNDHVYVNIRVTTIVLSVTGFVIYTFLFSDHASIIMMIVILKALESFSDILYAYFQKIENMVVMSKSIMVKSIGSILVFLGITLLWKNLLISLIFVIGWQCLCILRYDIKHFLISNREFKFGFKRGFPKKEVYRILKAGIPLGISVFITSYTTNLPRLRVESILGLDNLAYFGAFSFMSIGFFQVLLPVQIMLRPKLAKAVSKEDYKSFIKMILISIILCFTFCIILLNLFYFFGEGILTVVYNNSYAVYLNTLLILFIAQTILFINGIVNISLQAYQVFNVQVIISTIVLAVAFFSANYFIETYKLIGAGYLVMLCAVLNLILYSLFFIKKIKW